MLIVTRCVYTLAGRASFWHAVGVGCVNSKRRGVKKLGVAEFKNLNEKE